LTESKEDGTNKIVEKPTFGFFQRQLFRAFWVMALAQYGGAACLKHTYNRVAER
jgi:hypothetical protein